MLWLRFLKLLGVLALTAGTIGAVMPVEMPLRTRRRFAFAVAAPGFLLTWSLGFVIAGLVGHPLLSTWVLGSMGLSLLSLQGVLYCAGRDDRAGWKPLLVAVIPLVGTLALMIWRPG